MENKIFIAETKRLILRRYKEDVHDLFEYLSDNVTLKHWKQDMYLIEIIGDMVMLPKAAKP